MILERVYNVERVTLALTSNIQLLRFQLQLQIGIDILVLQWLLTKNARLQICKLTFTSLAHNNKFHNHNDCGIAQNVLFPRIKKLSCLDVVLATVLSIDTNNDNARPRATPVLTVIYSRQPIWTNRTVIVHLILKPGTHYSRK
jgi:hypothetical protein